MKKSYRISIINLSTGKRELLFPSLTSKKRAQGLCDRLNQASPHNPTAKVVIK